MFPLGSCLRLVIGREFVWVPSVRRCYFFGRFRVLGFTRCTECLAYIDAFILLFIPCFAVLLRCGGHSVHHFSCNVTVHSRTAKSTLLLMLLCSKFACFYG